MCSCRRVYTTGMFYKEVLLVTLVTIAFLFTSSESSKLTQNGYQNKLAVRTQSAGPPVVKEHLIGDTIISETQQNTTCDTIACENGGICLDTSAGKMCSCHPFYTSEFCVLDALVDVARSDCGATCTASSQPGSCYNAIDDDLLAGDWFVNFGESNSWIQISFTKFYLVVALKIRQRCHENNQNRGLLIETSGGSQQSLELACHDSGLSDTVCVDTYWQNFDLDPKVTSMFKITVASVCKQYASNGFKEIKVYGYDLALINIAAETFGSTCNASSWYNLEDYGCDHAIDEVLDPMILGSEWATDNEGQGAWIWIFFPGEYQILVIDFLQRCAASMHVLEVTADFSGGQQSVFTLPCVGGLNGIDCDGQSFQTFIVAPSVTASSVRFTMSSICMTEDNHGWREIMIYGFERFPDPNDGVTTEDPNAGMTTEDPNAGLTTEDPNAGVTTAPPVQETTTMFIPNNTCIKRPTHLVNVSDICCDNWMTLPIAVDRNGDVWMFIMRREDGSVDFETRGWNEYRNGFGDPNGEFWLGLQNMFYLTKNGSIFTMRIDMLTDTGDCYYAMFSPMKIGNEQSDYTITWGGVSSEQDINDPDYAGDGDYTLTTGEKFATFDHDSNNCADTYGGGWWYHDCVASKFTGEYLKLPAVFGISYSTLPDFNNVTITYIDMKLKVTDSVSSAEP